MNHQFYQWAIPITTILHVDQKNEINRFRCQMDPSSNMNILHCMKTCNAGQTAGNGQFRTKYYIYHANYQIDTLYCNHNLK